jgi:large subunit ribosomal protein L31e
MSEEKKEKKKKGESKVNVERIYTIPLRSRAPKWRRSEKAIFIVRAYLAKHLKASPSDVHIDKGINEKIFARGAKNPPKKIRVRAMKFDDGVVEAELKE